MNNDFYYFQINISFNYALNNCPQSSSHKKQPHEESYSSYDKFLDRNMF